MSLGKSSTTTKNGSTYEDAEFTNYFNLLSIDEVSGRVSSDAAHSVPKGQMPYSVEPQVSKDDALFALHQLFYDISAIRDFLLKTWDHVLGDSASMTHYPLPSAALLTSMGVELIKDMVQDISKVCENYGGVDELVDILCQATAQASGLTEEQMWEHGSDDADRNLPEPIYPFLNEFLLIPLSLLKRYKDEKVIKYNDPNEDIPFPVDQACPGSKNDVFILNWYYTQSHILATTWAGCLTEDTVMKDMRNVEELPHDLIHLSFEGQLFLDLQRRYPKKVERAYYIMLRGISSLDEDLENYTKFLNRFHFKSYAQEKARRGKSADISKSLNAILSAENKKHRFLRRNPVLCGLILFQAQEQVHKYSIEMLNCDTAFISPSHLYNALQQENLLNDKWSDLETQIMLFPRENLFSGSNKPSGLDNCWRTLLIQLGVPMSAFASKGKRRKNLGANIRQRLLLRNAEVLCSLAEKYKFKSKGVSSRSKQHMEAVLDKSIWEDVTLERNKAMDGKLTVQHAMPAKKVSIQRTIL